jgi:hypothetical protein
MLVIDANVAVAACAEEKAFAELGDELSAPPLMWSEARANLHLELDGRLRRGAAQLGMVIGVHELAQPVETTESGSGSSEPSEDDTGTAGDG